MANIVQLKRSSVANKIPEVANVAVGEPVVNLVDKVLYTKNGSNAIIVIGAGTTSNIAEGVNLYFTNTRAVSAFIAGDNVVIESNGRISASVIGGSGTPGGANTQVQFNDSGLFGATAGFTFDKSTNAISTSGTVTATGNVTAANFVGNVSNISITGLITNDQIASLNSAKIIGLTTANVAEVTNLYFTNTRAVSAFIAGTDIVIESNGRISANTTGGGGGASVTIANTSPTSPSVGDLYFDEDLLTLFIYYDDGDSDQWVEASPSSSNNPFEFSKSIAATPTEIFSFDASLYRAAKFLISVSGVSEYKLEEVFLIHDDTNVAINEPPYTAYNATIGIININYSANIVAGNVFLYGVAVSGAPAVRGEVNLIRA